ncbi:hypothetical protein PM082_012362 [Marasmius tenuissimus]|nr:hypothetical protein PM082_012362 [Marasmius tenuissimus]
MTIDHDQYDLDTLPDSSQPLYSSQPKSSQPSLKDHSDANVNETEHEVEPEYDDDGLPYIPSSQPAFTPSQSATVPSGDNGDNEENTGAEDDDQGAVSEPPFSGSSQPQSDVHRHDVFYGRHRATSPPPQNNTPTPTPESSQQCEPAEPSSSQPSMPSSSQDLVWDLGVHNGMHLPTGRLGDSQSD